MLAGLSIADIIMVAGIILVSITIHEAMHAFVAHKLGDSTALEEGRLTLNPLRHVDIFLTVLLPVVLLILHLPPIFIAKPVPINPERVKYEEFGTALIGIAGPLTNLALAGIVALVLNVFSVGLVVNEFLELFVYINIVFFVFNMIPFPPLDGSRLLYAVAPDPVRRVMEQIENMGFAAIIFFFVIFYTTLSDPFSRLLAGLFSLFTGGGQILL